MSRKESSKDVSEEVRTLLRGYNFWPEADAHLVGENVSVKLTRVAPTEASIGSITFRLFPPGNYAPMILDLEQKPVADHSESQKPVKREVCTNTRGEATFPLVLLDVACQIEARLVPAEALAPLAMRRSWIRDLLFSVSVPSEVTPRHLRIRWMAGLLCSLAFVLAAVWMLPKHLLSHQAVPQFAIQLSDSAGDIQVLKDGELRMPGNSSFPDWLSQRLRELLETGRASPMPEVAEILTNIDQQGKVLGIGEETERPVLLEPLSPITRSRFPTFRWQAVPKATNYSLSLENSGVVLTNASAGAMTNYAWTEKSPPLLPGETYTWRVESFVGGNPRDSLPSRFYVLSTNQISELRRMEEQCGNSAIKLVTLYESWGLFDEAVPFNTELQLQNPSNSVAARIATELTNRASDTSFDLIDSLLAADTTPEWRLALLGPSNSVAFANTIGELNRRATKASKAGDFETALRANSVATELATPLADKSLLGFCLIARAAIAIDQTRYTNAIDACKDAVELFRRLPKQPGLGPALSTLGKALTKAGQYQQAQSNFVVCLRLGVDMNNRNLQARGWAGIAEADRMQGNLTNALHEFSESLALDRQGTNQSDIMDDLLNLSNVRLGLGDKAAALSNLTECLNFYKQQSDLDGEAVSLNSIANVQESQGDFPTALSNLQQCLKIRRDTTNQEGIAVALNSIGFVYLDAGQAAAAMPLFKESAAIAQANNDPPYLATALQNLGIAYQKTGNFAAAWTNVQASYEIETNLPDSLGAAESQAQLAELLELAGLHTEAREAFSAAMVVFRAAPSPQDEALTLFNLAAVDDATKNFDDARSNLNASLIVREPLQDKQGIAGVRTAFGELELEAGNFEQAISQFRSALEIATNNGVNASEPICGIGEAELRLRHPVDAIPWFEKARDLAVESGDVQEQSAALTGLGEALRSAGRMPEAVAALESAESVIDGIRSTIQDPAQSIGFFGINDRPYQVLAFALAEVGRSEDAWKVVERGRARTLIEMMRGGQVPMAKAMTISEIAQSQQIDENLKFAILRDQAVSTDKMLSREQRSAAREQLNTARDKFDQFKRELYQKHPSAAVQHGDLVPPDLVALGPILGGSNTAVLEYLLGEKSMKIFVIRAQTNGTPKLDIVDVAAEREEIQKLAIALSENLGQSRGEATWSQTNAQRLHSLLIAPIVNLISNVSTLCVIPDEELWDVPFALLQDREGRAFVEDRAVFYAPSVTALIAMRNLSTQHAEQYALTPPEKRIMVMANPKLLISSPASNPILANGLDEFPGTARQASELSNFFGTNATIYVGADATEYRAKQVSEHYRILHFATHGVFVPSSPLHSGIFLTPGGGEDGFLEAREIMELNWNAELVVLAACETGRGQIQAGEGIWGLSWAMFVAGSPANLVTLWPVRDDSTADFMISFYKNLSDNRDSPDPWRKAEALRQAQLSLKADPHFGHPFFWAPFVLVGDGK